MPSNVIGERFKDGFLESASALGDGQQPISADYQTWIQRCVQQATAWARSTAISNANTAAIRGDFLAASDTYRDVLDHFHRLLNPRCYTGHTNAVSQKWMG